MLLREGEWEEIEMLADWYVYDLYPLVHGYPLGKLRRDHGAGEENHVLSVPQTRDRYSKEVYFDGGQPPEGLQPGMYRRAYNPLMDVVRHPHSNAPIHHRTSVPYGGQFGFSSFCGTFREPRSWVREKQKRPKGRRWRNT